MFPRLNNVEMIGRAVHDAQLKEVNNGSSKVASFRLAVNDRVKVKGEYKDRACFIDCESWGQRAEFIGENVKKGTIVYVNGKLEQDEWGEGKDKRSKHKIYVREIQVDRFSTTKNPAPEQESSSTNVSDSDGSDLPF